MEMKEKIYKEKVSENKTTEIHYKKHEIKPIYRVSALFSPLLLSLLLSNKGAWLWLL
jgi:hypothetical protein